MKYINGVEAKAGDKVVIVTTGNTNFYPYITTGEVLSICNGNAVVVKDKNGKVDTKLYNQVYPI